MTRKRAKKLIMSMGYQRNTADAMLRVSNRTHEETVQAVKNGTVFLSSAFDSIRSAVSDVVEALREVIIPAFSAFYEQIRAAGGGEP